MKKLISIMAAAMLTAGSLTACGSSNAGVSGQGNDVSKPEQNVDTASPAAQQPGKPTEQVLDGKTLNIVTTIFPEYDWVKTILGDQAANAEITMLLDNGVDLHSYQPTVNDIVKISTCDLFIYVGGESDEWVENALAEATNPDMVVINLLEVLGDSVKAEEIVEGMEHDHEHEHEEIEESEIEDRALAEFNGAWKSLAPMLEDGSLNEYVEHHAEEHGEPQEEVQEELAENWACDTVQITVEGDSISFVNADGSEVSGTYTYEGYATVMDEDGDITGVRFQFASDSEGAPKYVQFNDHGHEPAEEVEHFHVYYGDDSFDSLMESESNPFFVPEAASADEVLEELMGGHDHEHEEEELDEHVWLSLKNTAVLCDAISDALEGLDASNAVVYQANTDAYKAELSSLDEQYAKVVKDADTKTVLFGDRFPFRYLVDDYDLDYYAAFAGCSAESEASFDTIVFLAGKTDELGLSTILTIEGANHKIAETIRDNTTTKDQQILTMDSMQSTTSQDVANGTTYLSVMTDNLDVLQEALK